MFSAQKNAAPASGKLFVEDVFSTYLYDGNSSTQTITNGIDLAGKGGLVWIKGRDGGFRHILMDTARGTSSFLSTNATTAGTTRSDLVTSFTSSGFTLGPDDVNYGANIGGWKFASWTLREAPKFFDVVTWTGTGSDRNIAHNLGIAPGCVIIKRTDTAGDWWVYHTSTPNYSLKLNSTATQVNQGGLVATSTTFTLYDNANVNASGGTYVAYVYAHDATADGVIQCGSYTTTGADQEINLGWEPQWVLVKNTNLADNVYTGWGIFDTMRGFTVDVDNPLLANRTNAENGTENSNTLNYLDPTATGFRVKNGTTLAGAGLAGNTYIYVAIRRGPMRTPTLGTSVFKPITYTGDAVTPRNLTGAGFPPDYAIQSDRGSGTGRAIYDKLRGVGKKLITNTTAAEASVAGGYAGTMLQDGIVLDNNYDNYNLSGNSYVTHFFRRAPGFFDTVCYTGTGVVRTVTHNLGVVPALTIIKRRNTTADWRVTTDFTGFQYLNDPAAFAPNAEFWGYGTPTSTTIPLGTNASINASGSTYVAYLFASCPGVSKVGSYTGNGSSQTINCAFTTGARFVLIKRTDSAGDWYVWDSARGIVAGNDPHLSLNTTAAEVTTDDTIDTDSSGFVVNQVSATNVNVNAATYIYLAIA